MITPQPMNLHGWQQGTWPTNGKHYILTETGYNGATHTVWEWDGPFSGPNTFNNVAIVDLEDATGSSAGFPVNVNQAGSGGGHPSQRLATTRFRVSQWICLDHHDHQL